MLHLQPLCWCMLEGLDFRLVFYICQHVQCNLTKFFLSTIQCSTADCQITFHPSCARDAGLHMNTKRVRNVLRHEGYCGQHSIEQRKVRAYINFWQMYAFLQLLQMLIFDLSADSM
jgi:hypothetical protein